MKIYHFEIFRLISKNLEIFRIEVEGNFWVILVGLKKDLKHMKNNGIGLIKVDHMIIEVQRSHLHEKGQFWPF